MGTYLFRRLATLPLLLLGISAVSFALLNLAPGDPAEIVLRQRNPGQTPSPVAVTAMRAELGLDDALPDAVRPLDVPGIGRATWAGPT